jgi:chromosome segregation ATPase
MRFTMLLRATAVGLFFGLMALGTLAQDPNQSSDDVAAAARRARDQQKNAPAPKKVLTNDDIPSVKTDTPAATGDAAAKGDDAKPADKDSAAAENDPKQEAYWRKKFGALHDKIDTAQKELDVLQRELDKDQVQYYSDPQKAMEQQHDRSDVNNKTAQIDAKKKEIEGLHQQWSDLEDDLRKAGGDPGWAR